LVLDLEGVRFIDREGMAMLQRWSGEQLVLRNASRFVHRRLEKYGLV
jgi:anti-anti-sigma regulatory factor